MSHNTVAFDIFELLHYDIWGPFNTLTYHGKRFFLTLEDDCSRFTWIYLLAHKSEAPTISKGFFSLVENQFHKSVKVFRLDNAKELLLGEFFANKRVIHQFSCVERPQQNAVVERKHQHLLNVACSLYFQAKIPIRFWGDCVQTAAFLINRLPAAIL